MPFDPALLETIPRWIFLLLIPIIIWEAIWKITGAWKAARNNQFIWFIVILILILNTIGILPIVYILFFQKKKKEKRSI